MFNKKGRLKAIKFMKRVLENKDEQIPNLAMDYCDAIYLMYIGGLK